MLIARAVIWGAGPGARRAAAVSGLNLFTSFPPRVREARFHTLVTRDDAAAAG